MMERSEMAVEHGSPLALTLSQGVVPRDHEFSSIS